MKEINNSGFRIVIEEDTVLVEREGTDWSKTYGEDLAKWIDKNKGDVYNKLIPKLKDKYSSDVR